MTTHIATKQNINTELESICIEIDAIHLTGKNARVIVESDEKRTLSANAQAHIWAKAISSHTGEDVKTTFNRLKRDHALPILLADLTHGPVADFILKKTGFESMTDDQQLKIIDAMSVTRLFTTKQHNSFRDSVQTYWNHEGLNLDYLMGKS